MRDIITLLPYYRLQNGGEKKSNYRRENASRVICNKYFLSSLMHILNTKMQFLLAWAPGCKEREIYGAIIKLDTEN